MLIGQAVAAVNANAPVDACPAGPGDDVISIGVPGGIRAVVAGSWPVSSRSGSSCSAAPPSSPRRWRARSPTAPA